MIEITALAVYRNREKHKRETCVSFLIYGKEKRKKRGTEAIKHQSLQH